MTRNGVSDDLVHALVTDSHGEGIVNLYVAAAVEYHGRAMLEALIEGERDPEVLAEMAKGHIRVKHAALVEALTGRFEDHHAELARILLDQVESISAQVDTLTIRVEELLAEIPAAQAPIAKECSGPGTGISDPASVPLAPGFLSFPSSKGRPFCHLSHPEGRG